MTAKNTTARPCPRCGTAHVRTRERNTPYCSTLCRVMAKVDTQPDCWIWLGAQDGKELSVVAHLGHRDHSVGEHEDDAEVSEVSPGWMAVADLGD